MKNTELAESFGKILKKQRLTKNLSQAQLAKAAGVSVQAIRHFEHARRTPNFITLTQLVYGLDMTLVEFMTEFEAYKLS